MGKYKIDKAINHPMNNGEFPFQYLDVGDSFLVEITGPNRIQQVRVAANHFSQRYKDRVWSFKTRIVNESGKDQIRIWRVKNKG